MIELRMPEIGEGVTEATIVAWHKGTGEPVTMGETIVEIMTAKVNVEVESPGSGILEKILFGADEQVHIGTVIALIAPSG
ncbi:MAG: biotin/lipoyl-containing protein [Alphaproteobacteria bacterium]|nr:biotin/lipoyl-containing protein [Alphaproteobacteria bacterium]